MLLNNTSPIVTAPHSTTGGQIWFPIVNRIMIQIKNLDDGSYQTWGTRKSQNLAQTAGSYPFPYARVICEKAKVIPPAPTNNDNITSNITYTDIGTTREKVHKLSEFANSIILYKDANVPTNLEEDSAGNRIALKDKRVYNPPGTSAQNLTFSIPDSILGYEIKIWLENQYYNGTASKPSLTEDDLNVVTLNKITRKMDENGDEIDTYVPNSEPITFQKVLPPTELYVADYKSTDGFHVEVGRIPSTTIHYLECIIPQHTKISDGGNYTASTPLTTATSGQENDVFFKGYFIEYQTIEADTNATKTLTKLEEEFTTSGTAWEYVKFHTIKNDSNANVFTYNDSNSSNSNTNLARDEDAKVLSNNVGIDIDWTGATNSQTASNYGDGFISAGKVTSGAFVTKTADIDYSVSKAFLLPQGDNKFYRFRIRGLNTGNKKPGPPSTKYAYFIFNKPAPIYWNTPSPKFIPAQNKWSIRLTWKNTDNNATIPGPYYSSMAVTSGAKEYQPNEIAIMEYKLERRDTTVDTDNTAWRTISYWANTKKTISTSASNGLDITHDYQIWPTPLRTKDTNYADYTVTTNNVVGKISNGWVQGNVSNEYAEWNQATSANSSVYTVEARLMAAGRNPTFQFRIQARNYLYGKRKKSSHLENVKKQWLKETDITDTRWSDHSSASTALVTTAHTSLETGETNYKVELHAENGASTSYSNNKYQIKFYEKDSADTNSPWNGNHTDYHSSDRPVNYTIANNNANSTSNTRFSSLSFTNNTVPNVDYIAYQWKLSETLSNKLSTTQDAFGLSIDRYEIEETIKMATSSASTTAATTNPITVIYSPDFRYGPANWHINKYTPFITDSPSFKFRVRAFNFFNSTSSKYSSDSTVLTPTKPSPPRYLSTDSSNSKENSNPTFALTDAGITILVDEPQYTGYNTNSTNTQYNDNHYENQAISLSEFRLESIKYGDNAIATEKDLINHNNQIARTTNITGSKSQVVAFVHKNGYETGWFTSGTVAANTALKDLSTDNSVITYYFQAKNVLKDEFSATSSCSLTIGKPNPGVNFKYCPKFTWVASTNKVKLEFFRKNSTTDILYDDSDTDNNKTSTIAPLSAITPNNCNFSNTIQKLAWEVQCATNNDKWSTTTTIPNKFETNASFTTTGDDTSEEPAYTISDIYIEDQTAETTYTIDYRIRNQYNQNYFASNVSDDIGSGNTAPLQIKLDVPVWISSNSSNSNNVFTSKFTYGLPTAESIDNGNKILISWKRPINGGLYFKHQGEASISQVSSPNIKKYKIYLKATNLTPPWPVEITQIVVANNSTTEATCTHAELPTGVLDVGDKVTVWDYTGNDADLALNQEYVVASITSPTVTVLTGTGLTAGTYTLQGSKLSNLGPEYYICTITQNRDSGDYNNAIDSSTPTLTIYSGGTTSPASSTGNDTQTIVIKKITGGSATNYYDGTGEEAITSTNFRFKPEHEYTVEKITAFNWLYDQESDNMNNSIKTKYQNGINGGTTATITNLTPVQINALETVNYPPIGSNNYIATTASTTATAPTAVAGPQLNTFSQYVNNGSLINGAGISSTITNKKINKLAEIAGTSVSDIIINKDYAKIPNSIVGMSIRLGVKIGDGNETFTNFCTFTNSACADENLKYTWGTDPTETTIATISSGTSTATDVNPADIYTGTANQPWKTDNQTYWFASSSIQISTASTINDVTAFYGKSVVFKIYVYYHSENNLYNETFNNNSGDETYSDEAIYTLTNTTTTTTTTTPAAAGDY